MGLNRVDTNVHPYGLGGGYIMSGSVSSSFTSAFQYYPLTATSAVVKLSLTQNGSGISSFDTGATTGNISSSAWTIGIPINGPITQVTQSSGIAMVYLGVVTADGGYRI